MEDELIYDAAFYRKRAEEARQNAVKAISREHRDEYLGLAIQWDQLAADVDANSSEKRAAAMQPDPTLRATILALRARFDSTSSAMRELEREIASLPASARRERMSEFDARVLALMKEGDDIAISVRVFLRPNDYPGGNA